MKFFSSDWVAVFFTLDIEDFVRAKDILSKNNIQFRDVSINNQKRLGLNNLFARNVALSNNCSVRSNYILEVKSKDRYLSEKLLSVLYPK